MYMPLLRRVARGEIWLVLAFLFFYILPLGSRPLFIPDESRYAAIAGEIAADGEWFRLRQAGFAYYEKPPLGYWLNAASIALFGRSGFALRLPTAIAAGLSGLAVCWLAWRMRRDRGLAISAGIVYLTSVQVIGMGTFAVLDTMFSLFVTLSMACFVAGFGRGGWAGTRWLILSGIACGMGFLVKGFTALVIPPLVIPVWLAWEGRWRDILRFWRIPVLAALLITSPFLFLLHRANPDFWRYFLLVEHVQRFLAPGPGQHGQPVWFYLPVLAIGAVPWTFYAPAIAAGLRRSARNDPFARFCCCWVIVPLVFFSLCGGKLPTYILPCFAPFAILAADALLHAASARVMRVCSLAGAAALVAAMGGFAAWLFFAENNPLGDALLRDGKTAGLALSVLLAAALLFGTGRALGRGAGRTAAIACIGLSTACIAMAGILFLPHEIEDSRSPTRLLEATRELVPGNAVILADRITLPAVYWHYGDPEIVLIGHAGELSYGALAGRVGGGWVGDFATVFDRLQDFSRSGLPVVMIAREHSLARFGAAPSGMGADREITAPPYVWRLYLPQEPPAVANLPAGQAATDQSGR